MIAETTTVACRFTHSPSTDAMSVIGKWEGSGSGRKYLVLDDQDDFLVAKLTFLTVDIDKAKSHLNALCAQFGVMYEVVPLTSIELCKHCTDKAIEIWRKQSVEDAPLPGAALMPLLLPIMNYVVGTDLLFVGMNPSFSLPTVEKIMKVAVPTCTDVNTFFKWNPDLPGDLLERRVAELVCFEMTARDVYKTYYGQFKVFAERVGADSNAFAHIDMFLMRHTSQKEVLTGKGYGATFGKLIPFAQEQFELFRFTLKSMSPKVVVMTNAGASGLALEGLGLTSSDDGRSYRWAELPEVPIFLSGMISGQRALDTYSKTRLVLDVRAALLVARG